MSWVVIAVLVFVVLIVFGLGFAMDAAAHAKEAQATIEVARVAQVQSINNLISILVLSVLILVLTLIVVGMIVLAIRSLTSKERRRTRYVGPIIEKPSLPIDRRLPAVLERRIELVPPADGFQPAEDLFDLDLLKWLD